MLCLLLLRFDGANEQRTGLVSQVRLIAVEEEVEQHRADGGQQDTAMKKRL
ncbi:hypothetical protein AERO8C_140293 [Aeromonas veronii]|uniref:Uncharacterized protein n=1 Tax=Aeromonas veronii TaxID=654 RepID=A0A653KV78_AERVE|nr:hypothetical protein AERO8C_140293 [Aeromonas veronii]